jgi:ElaB/YqjD/DUF883 family membrane-anchored ribosome-binding protein
MFASAEEKEIHDKTQQAATDIRNGARRVKEDLREAANNVRHDVEDLARQAGKEARNFVGSAEKSVAEMTDSMTARIQDNPIQSIAISAGVGLVLGLLLSRR